MLSRIGYTFRETWASLRRNVTLTVAAILTSAVSLLLVGGTFLIQRGFDNLLSKWSGGVEMIVYVSRTATARSRSTRSATQLESQPTSSTSTSCSTSTSTRRWPKRSGCSPATRARSRCSTEDNMPTQFKVVPVDGQDRRCSSQLADGVQRSAQGADGGARQRPDRADQQARATSSQTVTIGLSVLLLIGAVLLIWNTIRTAMFARRREIEVMKLVGATNWFIRLPFMLEGLLQG